MLFGVLFGVSFDMSFDVSFGVLFDVEFDGRAVYCVSCRCGVSFSSSSS